MLISIIIPVFNTAQYLSKCLDSIFEQDYQDIEVIAINDGSTDNSLALLKKYSQVEARLRIFNKDNAGVVAARNLGLSEAFGEYIMFVDSDDYLLPNSLSKMVEKSVITQTDIIIGNIVYDYGDKQQERCNERPNEFNFKEWSKSLLADSVTPGLYARLYKKELFEKVHISNEFKIGEDFITSILLFSFAKKIELFDFPCYGYLQRADSVMHRPSEAAIASIPRFISWVITYYSNTNFNFDEDFQNKLAYFALNRYYLYMCLGGVAKASPNLAKTINNYLDNAYARKKMPSRQYWMLNAYKLSNLLGDIYRYVFLSLTKLIKNNR